MVPRSERTSPSRESASLSLAGNIPGKDKERGRLTSLNSGFKVFFLIWVLCLAFFPMSGFSQLEGDARGSYGWTKDSQPGADPKCPIQEEDGNR
jgi:hypothetical protein